MMPGRLRHAGGRPQLTAGIRAGSYAHECTNLSTVRSIQPTAQNLPQTPRKKEITRFLPADCRDSYESVRVPHPRHAFVFVARVERNRPIVCVLRFSGGSRGLYRLRKNSERERVCIRARVYSCRKGRKIGVGLQPLLISHYCTRLFPQPL